jgi:3'(2'), 5'-bisphosphate nucleotidase
VTPPADDGGFARWLAAQAGEELLALRDDLGYVDPPALRAAGDRRSHELLVTALGRWRPGDEVLSEEGGGEDPPAVRRRLAAERVWIVDPLDGTREFGEPGRTDWAVHVALWSRDRGLSAGAVALPAQRRVLATDRPPAYPAGSATRPPRLVASRTRPPAYLAAVAREVGGELVPMGSAGAKIAAVVTGEADAYLHAGGQYQWDSAAPVAVADATGLHTSRIDGSKLEYNLPDPRLPDLLVCRRDLADHLLAAVARHRSPGGEGES